MPPSNSRLPSAPNGVSALAANAAAPAGSVCTGLTSDGTTHGRLATAITASVTVSRRLRLLPDAPDGAHSAVPDGAQSAVPDGAQSAVPNGAQSATGTAASAVIDMAANPPTAAGTIATLSRHAEIRPSRPRISRSTHGSPA